MLPLPEFAWWAVFPFMSGSAWASVDSITSFSALELCVHMVLALMHRNAKVSGGMFRDGSHDRDTPAAEVPIANGCDSCFFMQVEVQTCDTFHWSLAQRPFERGQEDN